MSNVRRPGFTMVEWIVVIIVDVILVAVLLPATAKMNEAAARAKTQNNLKQLGLGLNNFDGAYNYLPHNQGISMGSHTRPALFHVLPYMENESYYTAFLGTQQTMATINYLQEPGRGGPGFIYASGATTDYATNGAIFGDITTTISDTVVFQAGTPTTVTMPVRHNVITNCSTYSIGTLISSGRGCSNMIFAGQKRIATDNYDTRAGDLGINATATTTTASSGGGGRGTPHAITSYFADKDPVGTQPVFGDWGSPYKGYTIFLFGDGHTSTIRNSLSGTAAFADSINPQSTGVTALD